jgi:hypothetical protein
MYYYYLFHYGLPIYSTIKNVIDTTYNTIIHTYNNIVFGLNSDTIVFYKNYDAPFFENFFLNNIKPIVEWRFNRYNKIFYSYSCMHKDKKHLPILSSSIIEKKDDNVVKVLYNLDNFIEEITIESCNVSNPTLTQFIYAWMYTNNIVLDTSKKYYLEYMDTNLNVFTKEIFVENFNFNT